MFLVYKHGGDWSVGDLKYTVKCVNEPESYLSDGWFLSLSEVKPPKKKKAVKDDDKQS